jgi:hypothetical protein
MYNTREALAYTGKLPEQQNQAAITPQLLDLLALQKVEADKKAAAQQLALTSGQAQPTVAQGLQQRAMQSARQEITQKLGLAGLAQAQPPAGPMPQQAPQQGLAGAQSNLPDTYQGGGIIAFAQGGSGGDAHGRFRQDDEQAAQSYQNDDRPPEMAPEKVAFGERAAAAIEKLRDQDPEAEQQRAMEFQQKMLGPNRDAAIARKREQQAGLKALYERQVAERPSNLQVALDRMAQNIHQRGGFGAAMLGVSPAVQAAREGYTKQEIAQLNTLSAIDDEIDKAIENNDLGKYNAGVARRKEVEGQVTEGVKQATTMADVNEKVTAGLQRNYETVQGRKQTAAALAQQKADAAAMADARIRELAADRSNQYRMRMMELGSAKDAATQLRRDQLKQKAATDAITLAEKADKYGLMEPEAQDALIKKYYNQIVSMAGDAPAAPGQSIQEQAAAALRARTGLKTQGGAR